MSLIVDGRDDLNELSVSLELLAENAVSSDDGGLVGVAEDLYFSSLYGVEELSPLLRRSLVELRIGLSYKFLSVIVKGEEGSQIVL